MDTWKYILVTLRLIEWTDKKTGEEQSCYAYSSGSSSTCTVFGSKTSASLSIRVGGERVNAPSSDVTLWMNTMLLIVLQCYSKQPSPSPSNALIPESLCYGLHKAQN